MGYRGDEAARKALWDIEALLATLGLQLRLQGSLVSRNLKTPSERRRVSHDVTVNILRCLAG